jgi:hypothetical protein
VHATNRCENITYNLHVLLYRQLQLTEDSFDENISQCMQVLEALLILSDEPSATFSSTIYPLLTATFKTAPYEIISELIA